MTPNTLLTPKSLTRIHLTTHPATVFPSRYLTPMQAVSCLAGDEPTDTPTSVCPLLASIFRSWTAQLSQMHADTYIRPLLPKLIGTNQGATVTALRAKSILPWLTRTYIPFLLDDAGDSQMARAFRAIPAPDAAADDPYADLRAAVNQARTNLQEIAAVELTPPDYGLRHPDAVHRSAYDALARHSNQPDAAAILDDLPHQALATAFYAGKNTVDITQGLHNRFTDYLNRTAAIRYRPSGRYSPTTP